MKKHPLCLLNKLIPALLLCALTTQGCKTRSFDSQADTEAIVDKTYELSLKPTSESISKLGLEEHRYFTFQVCKKGQTNTCYAPLLDQNQRPYKLLVFTQKDMDDLSNKGLLKGAAAAVTTGAIVSVGAATVIGVGMLLSSGSLGVLAFAAVVGAPGTAATMGAIPGAAVGLTFVGVAVGANAVSEKAFSAPFLWGAEERQLAKAIPALSSDESVKVPSIRKLIPVLRDAINARVEHAEDKAVAFWKPE